MQVYCFLFPLGNSSGLDVFSREGDIAGDAQVGIGLKCSQYILKHPVVSVRCFDE